jgi:hypothetical protein
MTFIAIAAFLLLLVVVAMVARPLLVPTVDGSNEDEDDSELTQRNARLLDAIRELDMDLATGKLSVEDHRSLRAQLVAEATAVLQQLDEEAAARTTTEASTSPDAAAADTPTEAQPTVAGPDDVEAAIEEEVARRRERLAAGDCRSCSAAREAGDLFCRRCGAALDVLQEARS